MKVINTEIVNDPTVYSTVLIGLINEFSIGELVPRTTYEYEYQYEYEYEYRLLLDEQ